MSPYLALDARLATLLGYIDVSTTVVSPTQQWVCALPIGYTTPGAFGRQHDFITTPAWCCINASTRDTGAIIDLIIKYEADIDWRGATVSAHVLTEDGRHASIHEELIEYHPDNATAMRVAVVKTVISLLEFTEEAK